MEEEEDDLYGTEPTVNGSATNGNAPAEDLEDGEEDEEEDDDEDDSDIEIVTERADLAQEPTASKPQKPGTESARETTIPTSTTSQFTRPTPTTVRITADTAAPVAQPKPILLPGDKYPALRTAQTTILDPENVPLWNGKPITDLDIDADLAEQMKPWRRPGADQADYFNYGFDEFTWAMYCQKQKTMRGIIDEQRTESKMFEQMMGGMGMPAYPGVGVGGGNSPMPGAGVGAGAGVGGPQSEAEMQAMMMQAMQAQGVSDPTQLDFGAFMQQMQMGGAPGMAVPTGPGGGGQQQWGNQGGYGQGGVQGGRRGGRGRW